MSSSYNITTTVNNAVTMDILVSDSQKSALAGVGALCIVLGLAAIIVRVVTRRRSGEKSITQDLAFGMGAITFIGSIAASICLVSFGAQGNGIGYAGSAVASVSFYASTLVFLRISLLCLYQDMIFHTTQYWKTSITLVSIFTIYTIAFIIAQALQCKPSSPGQCIDIMALDVTIGALDFIVNCVILAMPVKNVWQSRSHPDIKNQICYPIAFMFGFIACVLTLVHAIASTSSQYQALLYPISGVLILTLILISFAILSIPTLIRHRNGPIQSPTATHPHLRSVDRSASVLSWIPGTRDRSVDRDLSSEAARGRHHNLSVETIPTVSEFPTDLEKSTEALTADDFGEKVPEVDVDRTNSLRSFTRLGSLTGAAKPPSFLSTRTQRSRHAPHVPEDLDLTGITVRTEVQMSWEERRKRLSRGKSRTPERSKSLKSAEDT